MYPLLHNGLRVITNDNFSPQKFGRLVRKYKITHSIVSVEQGTALGSSTDFDSADFVSLREIFCGGERVPTDVREFLKAQLPKNSFSIVYGTTECGLLASYGRNLDTSGIEDNVVGVLRPNVEIKIVDISTRQALGVNERGEIIAKSAMCFSVGMKSNRNYYY